MSELLPALAFSLLIGAQFLAVIAVRELAPYSGASSAGFRQLVDASASSSVARI
jgi:hypothetical protein